MVIKKSLSKVINDKQFTELEEFMFTMIHWQKNGILKKSSLKFSLKKWDDYLLEIID